MKWQGRGEQSAMGTIVADTSAVGTINRPLRRSTRDSIGNRPGSAIKPRMTDTWRRARRQLVVALLILPAVVVAMVANQRRTDYVALLIGIGVAWVLVFLIRPKTRKGLVVGFVIGVVLGTGYVVAFAHSSGTIGSP